MTAMRRIKFKCELLAEQAMAEACVIALLEEGGVSDALKLLAIYKHGEVLPAPVVLRLEQHASKIADGTTILSA
jgi:hypothetical protein